MLQSVRRRERLTRAALVSQDEHEGKRSRPEIRPWVDIVGTH